MFYVAEPPGPNPVFCNAEAHNPFISRRFEGLFKPQMAVAKSNIQVCDPVTAHSQWQGGSIRTLSFEQILLFVEKGVTFIGRDWIMILNIKYPKL